MKPHEQLVLAIVAGFIVIWLTTKNAPALVASAPGVVSGGGGGGGGTNFIQLPGQIVQQPIQQPIYTTLPSAPTSPTTPANPVNPNTIASGASGVTTAFGSCAAGPIGLATGLGGLIFNLLGGCHCFQVQSTTTGQVYTSPNPTIALSAAGYGPPVKFCIAGTLETFQRSCLQASLASALNKASTTEYIEPVGACAPTFAGETIAPTSCGGKGVEFTAVSAQPLKYL